MSEIAAATPARFLALAGATLLNKERDEENDGTPLPVVAKDDELLCEKGEVVERQTSLRHFNGDATLLSAMTGSPGSFRLLGIWVAGYPPSLLGVLLAGKGQPGLAINAVFAGGQRHIVGSGQTG